MLARNLVLRTASTASLRNLARRSQASVMAGARRLHASNQAPKEFFKDVMCAVGVGHIGGAVLAWGEYYLFRSNEDGHEDDHEDDPDYIYIVVAKSLWHIDRTAFASTDFSSFESTMTYFHACVLVSEWAKQQPDRGIKPRDRLQLEDIATIRDRDKIDAKFAAMLAMADGEEKRMYHRQVRLACEYVHGFFQDYKSLSQDKIENLCSKPVKELTQEERRTVFGIGHGTNFVVAWQNGGQNGRT